MRRRGPSYAMNEIFGLMRQIVVHDRRDIIDMNRAPPRRCVLKQVGKQVLQFGWW